MHILTWAKIKKFIDGHAQAGPPLRAWRKVIESARFASPNDLRAAFPTAVIVGKYRTIFHIGGNKFRLIADVRYDLGRVYVKDVLTHEEYNRHSRVKKE